MWYVTFHGGTPVDSTPAAPSGTIQSKKPSQKSGVNKVHAYADGSGHLITKDVLPKNIHGVSLRELRGIGFGPGGDLYVVNSYSHYSQILQFKGTANAHGTHDFIGIFAAPSSAGPPTFDITAILHPFAFTSDQLGNWYISSQDTNVVTRLPPNAATQLTIAPYLTQTYPNGEWLAGTFVASSNGDLPHVPQVATAVPTPQGLDVLLSSSAGTQSGTASAKVIKSVRDVLFCQGVLYVADEPGNAVKLYDSTSGKLLGQIVDASLLSQPVHLCLAGDTLLIGSSGTKGLAPAVLSYNLTKQTLANFITNIDGPSGIAQGADGCIYVAIRKNKSIMKYDPQSQELSPFIQNLPDDPEFLLYVPNPT